MSYFDHNATTPVSPAAREAWVRAATESWQNPSSPYRSAARVRNLLEDARSRLAALAGCDPKQVVFNSGGTEGVNAVFQYCATRDDLREWPVLLSPLEHTCVLESADRFFSRNVRKLPLGPHGRIDLSSAKAILEAERFALVSAMAANNEVGAIQPWRELAEACREAGVFFHCDAAQWAGKMPLGGMGACGFVTASAHKFGGPKGCGFLIVPLEAGGFRSQVGGQQEHGARAGTEDYPAIAAMIAALEEAQARAETNLAERLRWREEFARELLSRLPAMRIAAGATERLWNTVSLVLPLGANERWVRKLDRAGFEVSTGSACSTGKEAPSRVLSALGFSPEESKRTIRVSSGWQTERQEWFNLIDAIERVYREMERDAGNDGGLTEVVRL